MSNGNSKNNKNNNGRVCIVPGTFDPVTNGHLDIIVRSAELFDKIYAVSFENSAKKTMFDSAERLEMLKLACEGINNAEADVTSELLVDYAKSKNAGFITRGIRNSSDFEYEYSMFLINREIGNNIGIGIETVFLPAKSEHLYISSAFVREMIIYKRDISKYVPEKTAGFITARQKNLLKSI